MTKAELSEAQERELQLAQQDKNMEQAKNKKNALESYVYETRNKVSILFSWGRKEFSIFLFWCQQHILIWVMQKN